MRLTHLAAAALMMANGGVALAADKAPCDQGNCENLWSSLDTDTRDQVFRLAEDYKAFLDVARTELMTVSHVRALARKAGFREWQPGMTPKPGDRILFNNRDRALFLAVIGTDGFDKDLRIAASHIDSPRLELKGRAVYEREGFALFQTTYHGGIKNFNWTNIPLALVGRVDKTDGSTVQVSVGLDADDPILVIPGLAPHVARDHAERKTKDVLKAEELDPLIASIPAADGKTITAVRDLLQSEYGIGPADFVSAELALVPAMRPRDAGLDRGLVAAYGQDDRASAFVSVRAILDLRPAARTVIVYLADNEESGNVNNTGANSSAFTDWLADLLYAAKGDAYTPPMLHALFSRAKVLSMDVNPGLNPQWPEVWEKGNAPKLGYGVNIKLYGRGFNAHSGYLAWMRGTLDRAAVGWQTTTYKVGRGGGGTLGKALSERNMNVLDIGVPVLAMHTPFAVTSKVDIHSFYRAVQAFFSAPD